MEKIHQLLNYSFAPIKIDTYISDFKAERNKRGYELFQEHIYRDNETLAAEYLSALKVKLQKTDYPNLNTDAGFQTIEFIEKCLKKMLFDKELTETENFIVDKLQKKFEVYHKVFDAYKHNVRKNSDEFQNLSIYGMLSIVLNLRFRVNNNFGDFNTSVKLNDLLLYSDWNSNNDDQIIAKLSLVLESQSLTSTIK